jgi:hypothetical protein
VATRSVFDKNFVEGVWVVSCRLVVAVTEKGLCVGARRVADKPSGRADSIEAANLLIDDRGDTMTEA